VLASFVIVTVIGSLLALVTNLSVAIALRLPWQSPISLGANKSELARTESPKLEFPTLAFGFVTLLVAQIIFSLCALTLDALARAVQIAIVVAAAFWILGIFVDLFRASLVHPYPEGLSQGDPDYDFALALARKSGAELKSVRVGSKPPDQGYQAAHGTIVLTQAQRWELTEAERQIVLTQWIGTLKYSSDTRQMRLLFTAAVVVLSLAVCSILVSHKIYGAYALMGLPVQLINAFRSNVNSSRATRESKAIDKFTLEAVGDYAAVQQALSKDVLLTLDPHQLSQLPTREKDQAIYRRLNKLREAAKEMGIEAANQLLP